MRIFRARFKPEAHFMFYYLSKTISILAMTITWVVLLLFYAWFAKRPLKKNIALSLTLLLLYFSSTPFFVNKAMRWWEVPPVAYSETPQYDVGIVLSGPVRNFKSPKDRVYIGQGSDRFLHAADLYKYGKIKHILVTGGHKPLNEALENEAEKIKKVLVQCGVPDSVITCESEAKNTRENALNSAEILKAKFPNQKYVVITSGYHMRRSIACFQKAGIEAGSFSTDFLTADERKKIFVTQFFPTSADFNDFSSMVKEMVGLAVYTLLGYA